MQSTFAEAWRCPLYSTNCGMHILPAFKAGLSQRAGKIWSAAKLAQDLCPLQELLDEGGVGQTAVRAQKGVGRKVTVTVI